jgi:hypothetical protein
MTYQQWLDIFRANISQLTGAMREIMAMEQDADWSTNWDTFKHDSSIGKDTLSTMKNLLPGIVSMGEDIDDVVLSELGINAASLPTTSAFGANQDIQPKAFRIAQIDMVESPEETKHAVLMLTKPTRTVKVSVYDMTGTQLMPEMVADEILPGVYVYHIDWSSLAVADGNYYLVYAQDGFEMDAKEIEIENKPARSLTPSDETWLLNNIGGGGGTTVPVNGGTATFG